MTTSFYLHGTPDNRHTLGFLALVPQPPSVMRIEPILDAENFVRRIFVTFKGSLDLGLSDIFAQSGYYLERPPEPDEKEIEKDGS